MTERFKCAYVSDVSQIKSFYKNLLYLHNFKTAFDVIICKNVVLFCCFYYISQWGDFT